MVGIYDIVRLAFLIYMYASALNAQYNRSVEYKTIALSKKKSSICLPIHLLLTSGCKVTTWYIKFMDVYR